ncbi:Laccase domain-containing protein 1 [Larimichthys crocea]|uniref:Purine nucleoside phosphorylase LACC1 n=1 Tax=Larimichthys crocea TaxID=215358 RepID=A0A6G0J6H6_LARCR|nr:Laccase domain-containing protein 1 [Larimichthys crocea]
MSEAVLLDLIHGCSPACTGASLLDSASARMSSCCAGAAPRDKRSLSCGTLSACKNVRVLDSGSPRSVCNRFKQTVDELDLSSVRVLTTPQGRDVLRVYQEQLFTPCTPLTTRVHEEEEEEEQVWAFLRQLPALKGDVTVLKSTLIPDCFGHGFSTRTGGVSYIPTLSSLNLFSSSRRRDPGAVVRENRRRLALHAGFHPESLRLVKVNHASDVWVLGKDEPESYDAMVTDRTGVVLAAPGADCMPILFADPVSKVIGAAHAGWKGTLMGVAMATVEAMVTEFGCQVSDIVVAVGPSVGACCFTLERDQALDFQRIHPDCVPDPESAQPHVNIRLANRILLQDGGILPENIHDDAVTERPRVTPCTSCHPRGLLLPCRDGPNFGTQVGFLWIRDTAHRTRPPTGEAV